METWLEQHLPRLVAELSPCRTCPGANTERGMNLPGQKAVVDVLETLVAVLFPGCHGHAPVEAATGEDALRETLAGTALRLRDQVQRAFVYQCRFEKCRDCGDCREKAVAAASALLDALPAIREMLQEDIQAAYEGDPAARSTMEIVMSYPGLYAITVHRLAHTLYTTGVPLIPRVMSEYAHSRTGIDIHPGAQIGPGFFIDHGTGVVIGETCRIGRRVKLYQGVTLGALSFAKDASGNLVKGIKRHPDVEDRVIIYAGATILGGETVIGRDSVIGANVWLIHSVPAGSKVYNQEPQPFIRPSGSRTETA
jgi:serine O-acetyltransferase